MPPNMAGSAFTNFLGKSLCPSQSAAKFCPQIWRVQPQRISWEKVSAQAKDRLSSALKYGGFSLNEFPGENSPPEPRAKERLSCAPKYGGFSIFEFRGKLSLLKPKCSQVVPPNVAGSALMNFLGKSLLPPKYGGFSLFEFPGKKSLPKPKCGQVVPPNVAGTALTHFLGKSLSKPKSAKVVPPNMAGSAFTNFLGKSLSPSQRVAKFCPQIWQFQLLSVYWEIVCARAKEQLSCAPKYGGFSLNEFPWKKSLPEPKIG